MRNYPEEFRFNLVYGSLSRVFGLCFEYTKRNLNKILKAGEIITNHLHVQWLEYLYFSRNFLVLMLNCCSAYSLTCQSTPGRVSLETVINGRVFPPAIQRFASNALPLSLVHISSIRFETRLSLERFIIRKNLLV